MNRNCYRLVFSKSLGIAVPVAENSRSKRKSAAGSPLLQAGVVLVALVGSGSAMAELPRPSTGGATPFVGAGQAAYQIMGNQAYVNQVGDRSILNWQSFNLSAGKGVQFRQVDSLATNNLVPGANFTSLNRIWDINPSVIAGSITQGAGQKANVIMVNTNGIAFMGGSQVNLNSFTASSLNIKDSFILDTLLPSNNKTPQFVGNSGFVKVFEGARITAGNSGRVMLIAPTVVNKGTVEAPDGQVIVAAAEKVYLRAASEIDGGDPNVRGLVVEIDSAATLNDFTTLNAGIKDGVLDGVAVKLQNIDRDSFGNLINTYQDNLGHSTNIGTVSAPRGNVTMMGYAVNQMGIARATTAVVANGSVYLRATDRAIETTSNTLSLAGSQRAGRVTLGERSLTEVQPEIQDTTGTVDTVLANGTRVDGLDKTSQLKVLAQDIRMASGAVIDASSGNVEMLAVDVPGTLLGTTESIYAGNSPVSTKARVHIASGATINVAGLEKVEVSAARNSVEVELRGDELKDSPVNQQGPLRGQTVFLDVNRALANSNAGKDTLIARDSLVSYQGRLERTVAERSTAAGTVAVFSQGEAIVEAGAVVDLSGGSVKYTPANVRTTLLYKGSVLTDLADALATTRYDGNASKYVVDYDRWNRKEVIDLGQRYRYDPGYTEGKNAGSMSVFGMAATYLKPTIVGRTTVGELQRNAGIAPRGARFTVGFDVAVSNLGAATRDFKINQRIELGKANRSLPSGFKFGDALPEDLKAILELDSDLLGLGKVASLETFANDAITVREALRAPQAGGVSIIGSSVTVNADIQASSGAIKLEARNTARTVPLNLVGSLPDPKLTIADGVTLTTRGAWVNDLPGVSSNKSLLPIVNGGNISLLAETQVNSSGTVIAKGGVSLGSGATLDSSAGAWMKANRKVMGGNGGSVTISAYDIDGLDQNVQAFGFVKGGALNLTSKSVQVGGVPQTAEGSLNIDPGAFERGGFSNFKLTALDTLNVADNTKIRPTVKNSEFLATAASAPTGSALETVAKIVTREDRLREAANLTLIAKQKDIGSGELSIGSGARIDADAKAKISLEARNKIEVQGTIMAHGGTITALLDRTSTDETGNITTPVNVNPIWLGSQAVLDVSGKALTYTDSRGQTQGEVLPGGTVSLTARSGYVVTQPGSLIDVSGAVPVRLDVLNEAGGIGRTVGSDAGRISLFAEEGALLDGTLAAFAGSRSNRGGRLDITLSKTNPLLPNQPDISLSLAGSVPNLALWLTPTSPIPNDSNDAVVRMRLGTDKLEASGVDQLALASRDAIRLENGLNLGAGRELPLRDIKLDAARIQTSGGDAKVSAETIRIGNFDPGRKAGNGLVTNQGILTVDAKQLELSGVLRLEGMAASQLKGSESIVLTGLPTNGAIGALNATGNLEFHGAVVAPASFTNYSIKVPQHSVSFFGSGEVPAQPLTALGNLVIEAKDIVQAGTIWAPFGTIDLNASDSIAFRSGSLTSVAAAPGSLTPFGKVLNGRTWVYEAGATGSAAGQSQITALPEKSIRISGKKVDLQAGAKVNLAGGGDLQAYEFTVGPGGSRDILADANTYAVVPGYTRGTAPSDPQEKQGFNRLPGDAVYLSGVPGLKDGTYTLLPAHYALMPGAFAVKLDTGVKNLMPGQSYNRQDGVRIAAGYVTDSRANAPRDANWQGVQVLSGDQVRARSEFTLTKASDFFAATNTRPQDAGLLSITTSGVGADALKLDASFNLAAGERGRGGVFAVGAANMALVNGLAGPQDLSVSPDAIRLDVNKLNEMGADSLLVGATRSVSGDTKILTVVADTVTLANDATQPLKAKEVILAAKNLLELKAGSAVHAQSLAGDSGGASAYSTVGDGALLRAAATTATFSRTGNPARVAGTLIGDATSIVRASDSILLDATLKNDFKGDAQFVASNGLPVTGNLALGGSRVSFGAGPAIGDGITFSQSKLNSFNSLNSLTLNSYSAFDFYGGVDIGGVDVSSKPTLKNLTLQGGGLVGVANTGATARLRAQNLQISNTSGSTFSAASAGTGSLEIVADTLTLGVGKKAVEGFSSVSLTANELIGQGGGSLAATGSINLNVSTIRGEKGSAQSLTAFGALVANNRPADRALVESTALGAKWAINGQSVNFNTKADLPSGALTLTATAGDVNVGPQSVVDLSGRTVKFFDASTSSWGGTAEFVSETGNVNLATGAKVMVSAAPGAEGGVLNLRASNGSSNVASGSVQGFALPDAAGKRGNGASVSVDTGSLASFSEMNTALNSGGFDGERKLRVRNGDISVSATDKVAAKVIQISVDGGKLDLSGVLDVSGVSAGRIELFSRNDLTVKSGSQLKAVSSGASASGGDIELGSSEGRLKLESGGALDVAGGSGGRGGTVALRALRTGAGAGNEVAVTSIDSAISGARSTFVEAVKVYNNVNTLTATGNAASSLSLATLNADNTAFATSHANIKSRLGKTLDPSFHILSGAEVRSTAALSLGADWNLSGSRAGNEAGVLTLRAAGNLNINNNLSDGFSIATPCTTATCAPTASVTPATLRADNSWAYRLAGGADLAATNPLTVKAQTATSTGHLTVAAGKLVRTGTGDIRLAAGGNIVLTDNRSVVYSAGRVADANTGFVTPLATLRPVFAQDGGDVTLTALGHITGKPSEQIYSEWLYRQGALDPVTGTYTQQPAWWVRYDQFQQGVGALGGGDILLRAGGNVKDVSASVPTQGRMGALSPDDSKLTVTGGGTLQVESGADVLGGQYFAGKGEMTIKADGAIKASDQAIVGKQPLQLLVALGDSKANVQARNEVEVGNVLNPQLLFQSEGNLLRSLGVSTRRSLFSTYSEASSVDLKSLTGDVSLLQPSGLKSTFATLGNYTERPRPLEVPVYEALAYLLPPTLSTTSFQGAVSVGTADLTMLTMSPSPQGNLTVLAAKDVVFNSVLSMSDADPAKVPSATTPGVAAITAGDTFVEIPRLLVSPSTPKAFDHSSVPVHLNDLTVARVYSATGDVAGIYNSNSPDAFSGLNISKPLKVHAGQDMRNLNVVIQHANGSAVSTVEAGRDILFSGVSRRDLSKIWIAGPGRLEVSAGRDIDLGTSGGIVSRGNLDNINLPSVGADLQLAAGVGAAGVDYQGAVSRLTAKLSAGVPDAASLWQARWLVGDDNLSAENALAAVKAVQLLDLESQRQKVRNMLFTGLRTAGRDAIDTTGTFAGDYTRAYAALETVFPGISEKSADGKFTKYNGRVDLFASRVKAENGGNIDFLVPGGALTVGLSNTPDSLVSSEATRNNVLGIVAVGGGSIKGVTRDDMLVNQSRILSVGGGNVLLWSSEGDIDAGKGKKTASAVPPPITTVDDKGNVTQVLQGAVSGSGIGALSTGAGQAGDVDLYAPKGTINAGDAGIRAGNFFGGAQLVIGADNISVTGRSVGTPVADTSAVTAAASGATTSGDDISKTSAAATQSAAAAAANSQALANAFKPPPIVSVDVLGFGR